MLNPGIGFVFSASATLVTGTVFLMWLGEQITERGIGNGISMIILASIVSGLPAAIGGTLELVNTGGMNPVLPFVMGLLLLGVTGFVVYMERAQRRITVNYAKRQQGRRLYAGQTSHLPFKINMSGVIRAIFASSLILFPATIATWFGTGQSVSLAAATGGQARAGSAYLHPDVCGADCFLLFFLYLAGFQFAGHGG